MSDVFTSLTPATKTLFAVLMQRLPVSTPMISGEVRDSIKFAGCPSPFSMMVAIGVACHKGHPLKREDVRSDVQLVLRSKEASHQSL